MKDWSDADLMRACAARRPEALEELLRRLGDAAYRLARGILGNDADAEEVVSETFWRIYERADRFDPNRPLGPWLFRIAANLARSRLRASRPEVPLASLEQEPAAESPPVPAVDPDQLEDALAALPEEARLLLSLRYGADMPLREMAEALGLSESAATSRLHRARVALRRALKV